jgi:hypothetical protein
MFDVKTAEVVERLKAAVWPLQRNTFLNTIGSKPDFYGPTWIAATLVFVIGAGSNLSSWLSFTPGGAVSIWKYDFRLVTFALMAVYAFAFGVSSAFFLALNYLGVSGLPLVYLVCIYGESSSGQRECFAGLDPRPRVVLSLRGHSSAVDANAMTLPPVFLRLQATPSVFSFQRL